MGKENKLKEWQDKYEEARTDYSDTLQYYDSNMKQYDGERQHIVTKEDAKQIKVLYNFTKELIESQIDSNIPQPLVTTNSTDPKKKERAAILEALLKTELKRLKFTEFNDTDERVVKKASVDFLLLEWDNMIKTTLTNGAVGIKHILPAQLIPQAGVIDLEKMDYFFLTFEDTRERLEKRYNKKIEDVSPDPRNDADADTDNVTQIIAFYKNDKNTIGAFSWVYSADTILIDDEHYNARGKQKCENCGRTKLQGEKACVCGSKSFEKNDIEYEELTEDIVTSWTDELGQPVIIAAETYARDPETKEYLLEDYEEPVYDYDEYGSMIPMYEQEFDDKQNVIGERQVMQPMQRPYLEPTKIPYYVPKVFPIAMRYNISLEGEFRGDSDCETIWKLQDSTDKLLTKAEKRGVNSGSVIAKLQSTRYNPSNDELSILECRDINELNGIKTLDLRYDTDSVTAQALSYYTMAKSLLGITDTMQGKPDRTATSGTAKEIQVAQSQGRQMSKQTMKDAFYIQIFERMAQYYLAYSDEPRTYISTDEKGESVEKVFSRYDFLDQDEYGNYYYDDDFVYQIDPTGTLFNSKQFQLEDMQKDMASGMFGEITDPNTKLMYWKRKSELGYPGAKQMEAYFQDQIDKAQQQMEEQALMQQQMGQMGMQGGQQPMGIPQQVPQGIPQQMQGMPPMMGGM